VLVIIDYNAGNLTSVQLALRSVGVEAVISRDPAVILAADSVIFPGVGAAGSAMQNLAELGLRQTVIDFTQTGKPFLGICIGCQILLGRSDEDGGTECLSVLPGRVKAFADLPNKAPDIKIPHMGWNAVRFVREHPVLQGIPQGSHFYFVHGFYPELDDPSSALGVTEYAGVTFPAIYGRGNIVACQFHVEKSGEAGLRLLKNFCGWDGT
jgi:glutamine amidotransferase